MTEYREASFCGREAKPPVSKTMGGTRAPNSRAKEQLFLNEFGEEQVNDFEEAMNLRESVDYASAYTDEDAGNLVLKAREFLENAKRILRA